MSKVGNPARQTRIPVIEASDQSETDLASVQIWQESITGKCYEPGTFGAISCEWLRFLRPQLKQASIAKYITILNSHLLPAFQDRKIEDIQRSDVTALISKLLASGGKKSDGLSPRTVSTVRSVLKNVFDYASRERGICVADIDGIPIKQPQKQMRILSRAEQEKLSRYLCANPTPCHLGILVCLYTGLRIGEICALQWQDISFDDHYLYVHKAMQRVQYLDCEDKRTEVCIAKPKSDCSIRRIPLPDELFHLLQDSRKGDEAFLLTGSDKKFIEPRTMQNHFRSVMDKCEIPSANFHALRHTFATRCVELGFDVKSLSEILGHSNVNITMNRYVHPSMELKQRNMNMLGGLMVSNNSAK